MLLDDEEIRIMSAAEQPQLRSSAPDQLARYIHNDFLLGMDLGIDILEIGPGQCDFARLVAASGAKVTIIDHDPAVVELGRRRGYRAIQADVLSFDWSSLRGRFDGLFARNSISPPLFDDPNQLESFIDAICATLKPGGWGWILPWNRFWDPPRMQIGLALSVQRQAFRRNGFLGFQLEPLAQLSRGIHQQRELFLRGLSPVRLDPGRF